MTTTPTTPGARLARSWDRLRPLPGGSWLFSRMVGRMAPYSGTIGAHVRELRPGYARLEMRDRPRLRNHLDSVHAVALANLAELASGLAMTLALEPGVRGIPVALSIEYLKKARGRLVAEGRAAPPPVTAEMEADATAEVRDPEGDMVARATVRWRLRPEDPQPTTDP